MVYQKKIFRYQSRAIWKETLSNITMRRSHIQAPSSEDGKNCTMVKDALTKMCGKQVEPADAICLPAVRAAIDALNTVMYIKEMQELFNTAGLNKVAKFGLICQAVWQYRKFLNLKITVVPPRLLISLKLSVKLWKAKVQTLLQPEHSITYLS